MVILKKQADEQGKIRYTYLPDGIGKPGVIEMDKASGEISFIEIAENDSPSGMLFKGKSIVVLNRFRETNEYPDTHTVYWG